MDLDGARRRASRSVSPTATASPLRRLAVTAARRPAVDHARRTARSILVEDDGRLSRRRGAAAGHLGHRRRGPPRRRRVVFGARQRIHVGRGRPDDGRARRDAVAVGGCCTPAALVSTAGRDRPDLRPRRATTATGHIDFLVPEMHCAACIGRIEDGLSALARRHPGPRQSHQPPRRHRLRRRRGRSRTRCSPRSRRAGYSARPFDASAFDAASRDAVGGDLVRCLAVAGFAAGNIMLLSVSVWSGASDATRELFHWLSALIALPAIAYAGRPFFRSALRSISAGSLNMDVPISIGVLLAAAMSLYETATGGAARLFRRRGVAALLPARRPLPRLPDARRRALGRGEADVAVGAERDADRRRRLRRPRADRRHRARRHGARRRRRADPGRRHRHRRRERHRQVDADRRAGARAGRGPAGRPSPAPSTSPGR